MKNAKKSRLLCALACMALLSGCGSPSIGVIGGADGPTEIIVSQEVETLPETTNLKSLSAPAEVIEGREPTVDYPLPTEMTDLTFWDQEQDPVALLAETEDGDAALYGVEVSLSDFSVWVRWGDAFAEFAWSFSTSRGIQPQLWCFDADGDGAEELVAVCYCGSGTGVSVYDLHIVEKSADGTLTDYCLPRSLFGTLSSAVQTATVNGRTYAALGTELVDISDCLREDADPAAIEGLIFGDVVDYEIIPDAEGCGGTIRVYAEGYLEGADYPPTAWYVAGVSAQVQYENGTFILDSLHLNSL